MGTNSSSSLTVGDYFLATRNYNGEYNDTKIIIMSTLGIKIPEL